MPMPLSVTRMSASVPRRSTATVMRPRGGVYFTALSRRLVTTCSSRVGSPSTTSGSSATESTTSRRRPAAPSYDSTHRLASSPRSSGRRSRRIFPDTTRETSRRSSTSIDRRRVCRSMISRCFASGLLPAFDSVRTRTAAVMAPMGLRSSWPSTARNSVLRRVASSASWRALRSVALSELIRMAATRKVSRSIAMLTPVMLGIVGGMSARRRRAAPRSETPVATRPGPSPPYHALTMTAARKISGKGSGSTSGSSARDTRSASTAARTARPYFRRGDGPGRSATSSPVSSAPINHRTRYSKRMTRWPGLARSGRLAPAPCGRKVPHNPRRLAGHRRRGIHDGTEDRLGPVEGVRGGEMLADPPSCGLAEHRAPRRIGREARHRLAPRAQHHDVQGRQQLGYVIALTEEGNAAVKRRGGLGDGVGITPAADDEEARRGAAGPDGRHGVEQVADALLPREPSDGADRQLVRGEAEGRPRGRRAWRGGVEAGDVDAFPQDVQLVRRSEARVEVPALLAVRDHHPRVDVTPGEAVDPPAPVELVRRAEKKRHAPAAP